MNITPGRVMLERRQRETDNQCELQVKEAVSETLCVIVLFLFVLFAKSLTFPVITKLMISFDLWRLREAFGFNVLKCSYISSGDTTMIIGALCEHHTDLDLE